MQVADFSLYLITDRHQTDGRPLFDVVRRSLEGGVRAVQLRSKDSSGADLYRMAVQLRRLTADYDARLIVNDRPDVALAADADGVHVGVSSVTVIAARQILGQGKIIGYSAHVLGEALCAQEDGADFVTFSPVYNTPSKAAYGEPCGLKKLAATVAALKIPVIALGGISSVNIIETLSTGVRGIAVVSAILTADDPRVAAVSLLKKIEEYAQRT